MDGLEALLTLHSGLPREAPGDRESLGWALEVAGTPRDARILDAGCGPGADIAGLLAGAPEGRVLALDQIAAYAGEAARRHAGDARVEARQGDMGAVAGPFDLVWSAGAVYFLGIRAALEAWRGALAPGGRVAFSHLVWRTDDPAPELRAFWNAEYPDMAQPEDARAEIAAAGWRVLGERFLSQRAWMAYYTPLEARIAQLKPEAGPALRDVIEQHETEIAIWRRHGESFGYLLFVTEPA